MSYNRIAEAVDQLIGTPTEVSVDILPTKPTRARAVKERNLIQYIQRGNAFSPSGPIKLVETLPPAAYNLHCTPGGIMFEVVESMTDELYLFENSKMHNVLQEVKKFWTLKDNFQKLGFLHNRGILLYGPPGAGKSALLQQVSEAMITQGDTVFFSKSLGATKAALKEFREVEPNRKVVVVFEDLDNCCASSWQEGEMLQLLDGADSVDNVLYLGTTNYIERFSSRLLRPGRFDKKIKIDFPPVEGRLVYLQHKLEGVEGKEKIQWLAEQTNGFSFGHLRELVIACYAFKEDANSVIERLKDVNYNQLTRRNDTVTEGRVRKIRSLIPKTPQVLQESKGKVPQFENKEEFIDYLQDTLIPDLEESGMVETAEDFEEAVYWMTH